jgi:hypothetical protein
MIPSWVLWLIAISGVIIAAFKTWRDQKRIVEAYERQADTKELEHTKTATRKIVKDTLGLYLESIDHRIIHVENIDWFTIKKEDVEKELFDWCDFKKEIFDFLNKNFSGAEAAYFGSDSDARKTPIDDNDEPPLEREKRKQRQWLLDQMVHHSKQLRTIIEKTFMAQFKASL